MEPVVITLLGLIVPLALDTFAVAAALGLAGLPPKERRRVSGLFAAFETGMPLLGYGGGKLVGQAVGGKVDILAIAILVGLGLYMLVSHRDEKETARVALLARTRGLAALGLGLSISLDELAIGFTLGLFRFPVLLIVALIGAQTYVVTQLGIRLGARLGEGMREGAERVAGLALMGLGFALLLEKLLVR